MPVPQVILDLVHRFHDSRDLYRSGHYNEAQLRREFLDPFFAALGWDMTNAQNFAPQYREVIQEDTLEIEGQAKAPDYSFGIFGTRKFFVEAKKPAVNIRYDIHPAFQLRRYAWSAHLPLSILTDFEEFAVYDTRVKPDHKDSASVARTMVFTYDQYAEHWDKIASVFSKDAILKGSFDRYVQDNKAKKGTAEVDDDFLNAIEEWRTLLARNIALRNPSARKESTLNYAVQMTIDRLIFLRICEDRGIEPENQLRELTNTPGIYPRLVNLYIKADQKYNSGLFHFSAEKGQTTSEDQFTPTLAIDDKVLKEIITSLYYPQSAYAFKVIPVEILGQVYEQFLGKVIRLTPGGTAKIEEKPEVRKAGGVYYTPRYIVDYIVANTLGKLLEGKTPREAAELRVVDPACGSGSFLLGAYQYLLDWHQRYYLDPANGGLGSHTRGRAPALVQRSAEEYALTTTEKKRILVNNIYGVDLDHQAVEVTKLSLLLKLLEEETGQLSLGFERVLPDLGHNIRCGNSLIGWDYFQGQLLADEEEVRRVNPFDWRREFPEVFARGGFDVVIGNPPWGANLLDKDESFIKSKFSTVKSSSVDTYAVFIEAGVSHLKNGGFLGFITPDTFLRKKELMPIRKYLLTETNIIELIETGPVFSQVRDTWCLVFTVSKGFEEFNQIHHLRLSRYIVSSEERLNMFYQRSWDNNSTVPQNYWQTRTGMVLGYLSSQKYQSIIKKVETQPSLEELKNIYQISRGEEGSKFNIKEEVDGSFWMVTPKDINQHELMTGVKIHASSLTPGKIVSIYTKPKIWIIRIQKMRWKQRIVCAIDKRVNSAAMKTLQSITLVNGPLEHLTYLSAILNSKLMNFWCVNYLADDINQSYLSRIPVVPPTECAEQFMKNLVSLVDYVSKLKKTKTSTPFEANQVQQTIISSIVAIDQLVYELYGLTEEEIRIVESTQ